MASDVNKHLERAKRYLEKNKLQEAVQEYLAVLQAVPTHTEAIQVLGDLYSRLNQPERAAHYHGLLFDRYVESRDETKAAAVYARFLKSVAQPPERMARYGLLLQKQNRLQEALEQYSATAERYLAEGNGSGALACWEKIAQLDPDNPACHVSMAQVAEQLGKTDLAARGYLRAGQLNVASGELDRALELFGRAHARAPRDRSVILLYAEVLVRRGDVARAVELLEPFAATEPDPSLLQVFGEALMRAGQLDRARKALEQFYREKPGNYAKLFELADYYVKASQDPQGIEVLSRVKERMFTTGRHNEFTAQLDRVAEANPRSVPLIEFYARVYEELNREAKYFDILAQLFDLDLEVGNVSGACEALDRLLDIDPYDFRNQERIALLEGKADPAYLRSVTSRLAKAAKLGGETPLAVRGTPSAATPHGEEARARQALDDLLVQAEIFLQYSLASKAIERLQRVADMFPGEEEHNERLRNLYEQANWWPARSKRKPESGQVAPATPAPAKSGAYSAETLRDLTRVSDIARLVYRQSTPKTVLSTAVNEVGAYLRVTRCLAVLGPPGQPPQLTAEFSVPGVSATSSSQIVQLLAQLREVTPDALGGHVLQAAAAPILSLMGLKTILGIQLTDKETQSLAGMLLVGDAIPRKWKPNESYFLQAVGDQMLLYLTHAKLRSLVRTLAVADEKTGLLGRSSYLDCLLVESNRAKSQGTPLSLVILQIDRGAEILRQHGEAQLERYIEQLAREFVPAVRQNDLAVKYTASALAFILPDTLLASAQSLTEKLRKTAAAVRPPWDQARLTLSAAVVQAISRPDYDGEDIVTDLINRAESCLEEAKKKGGDTVVSL